MTMKRCEQIYESLMPGFQAGSLQLPSSILLPLSGTSALGPIYLFNPPDYCMCHSLQTSPQAPLRAATRIISIEFTFGLPIPNTSAFKVSVA